MKSKKLANQIAVVFALITFSTSTVFAAPTTTDQSLTVKHSQNQIEIPLALGEVSALSTPADSKEPFFIHIQDAHANEMAQRNIKALLELLNRNYGVKLFGIEGAHKTLQPSVLHVAKNPNANLKIAEYLVTRGWLSGGDWFALEQYEKNKDLSDVHFEGLETASLFTRDLRLFRTGLDNRSKIDLIIDQMNGNVDRLKSKYFSRNLMKFDKAFQLFSTSEHKNILDYFKEIKRQASETLNLDLNDPINQTKYPQLVRLSRLIEVNNSVNSAGLAKEIEQLKELVDRNESNKETAQGYSQILNQLLKPADQMDHHPFISWREAFEAIYQWMIAHQITWKTFPAMSQSVKNLIFQEELSSADMFAEIDVLVNDIENKMAKSLEETSLIALSKEMSLLKQMARLEASREQAEDVLARKQSLMTMIDSLFGGINHESSGLTEDDRKALDAQLQTALQFYRGAQDREKAFVDHLLEYAKRYHANRLAFITGGYHTRGVQKELERRGFGYMSIAPRMLGENPLQGLKESSRLYEDVMTGKQKTIFATAYIPEEDNALSVADSAGLGVKNRVRSQRLIEATVNTGAISELANEGESLKAIEVPSYLQKVLASNKILGSDGIQVAETKDESGKPMLRISLASDRRGIITDFPPIVEKPAIAASLGAEEKGLQRRELLAAAGRLGVAGILGRVFGGLGLAGILGATGCGVAKTEITVPPDIFPEQSGQLSVLPKNNFVNPQNQLSEPRPAVTFVAEDTSALGTQISGDSSLLSTSGVNTYGTKVKYNLDDSIQMGPGATDHFSGLGISFDDFTTLKIVESVAFKKSDEVVFYVKSDANTSQLRLTVEGANSIDPAKKQQNFFTLKNTNQGGWYRLKISDLKEIDISKIYTMAIVADPGVLGTKKAKGSFVAAFAGIVPPAIPVDVVTPAVDASQTSHLYQGQQVNTQIPEQKPEASVTGGSTDKTTVFKKDQNTTKLHYEYGQGQISGMTVTRNNFDDNNGKIPANLIDDDFIDGTKIGELVFNIEKDPTSAGVTPKIIQLEVVDDSGNPPAVFDLSQKFDGTKATVKIKLDGTNFPASFNLKRLSFNLICNSPYNDTTNYVGDLLVTVRGVEGLYYTKAQPLNSSTLDNTTVGSSSDLSFPVTRSGTPAPIATMAPVGGATAFNDVQLINGAYGITEISINKATSGQFGGTGTSANRNLAGGTQLADLMDGTGLSGSVTINHEFESGSDLPDSTIVEIISRDLSTNKVVSYRTFVDELTQGPKGITIKFDPGIVPEGFKIDQLEQLPNVIYKIKPVAQGQTPVTKNIKSRVQLRGYKSSPVASVGTPYADTDVSTLGPAFSVGGAQVSGTAPTYDVSVQTNPPAGTESGFEFRGNFDITKGPIRINLQQVAGNLGNLSNDFRVRFIDGSGKIFENSIPVIYGTKIPGDKLGYTIFTNDTAIPTGPGAINKKDIRKIQFVYVQRPNDTNTYSGTQRVTAQSLGAAKTELGAAELGSAAVIKLSFVDAREISDSIYPLLERIQRRFPDVSRELIASIYTQQISDAIAELEASAPKAQVSKIEKLLQELQKTYTTFAKVQEGYGLEIEIKGDRIPTDKELKTVLADLKLHPELFFWMIYTGPDSTLLDSRVKKLKAESDLSGREIDTRFAVIHSDDDRLKRDLAAIPSQVFKAMNKSALKVKPKNLSELIDHVTILGDDAAIAALPLVYTNSVKIKNDIQQGSSYDSDLATIRILGGHFAVKSYAGLEPEIRASLAGLEMRATDLLGQKLAQIQEEIKAVISVMVAA